MRRGLSYSHIYATACNCIVAILICLKLMNETMLYRFHSSEGFFSIIMLYAYATFAIGSFLMLFVSSKKVSMRVYSVMTLTMMIVVFWYLASLDVTNTDLWQLVAFVLLPTVITCVTRLRAKTILTTILVISIFCVSSLDLILVVDWRGSIDMEVSYALLPPILAGIIHFSFYRKEHKWYYLLYIIPVFYLIKLLTYGVRGPIFCILTTFLLIFILKPESSKKKQRKIFFGAIVILVVTLFYESLLLWLHDILSSCGIQLYFIDKFIALINENEVSHGRDTLLELALNGFFDAPIFGNGLNSFEHFTKKIYPHNFLAQLLFEGGLLMFTLFLIPVFIAAKKIYHLSNENSKIVFIILFSVSVPYFILSASMWTSPLLWLFLGYCINVSSVQVAKN